MLTLICGVPGKGKTALATQLAMKQARKGRKVFSNYPISYKIFGLPFSSYEADQSFFQNMSFPEGSFIILDEAQMYFNSRFFKNMTMEEIKYFGGHRHLGLDIVLTSQHPNRVDITLRELCDQIIWIRYALPFGFKICYVYYLADHVGRLPPEVPKDFIKLRIHRISKDTYKAYNDKYLKDRFDLSLLDDYGSHGYLKGKYIPFIVRAYASISSQIRFAKEMLQLRRDQKQKDKVEKSHIQQDLDRGHETAG